MAEIDNGSGSTNHAQILKTKKRLKETKEQRK